MLQRIKEQYALSNNLEARMSIYQYSIDPQTFSQWLTEQIVPGNNLKILELGCGTGTLWKDLTASFHNCEIVLSDLSKGMLEKARGNLGEGAFHYEIIDFINIPYADKTFDIVISNHNLYHAADLNKVLGEISRVIKDNGVFYSTTNGAEHLTSLQKLIDLPDDIKWPNSVLVSIFGAETGVDILSNHFQYIERRFYQNELRIKDFTPILNYFMSFSNESVRQIVEQSVNKIQGKFEAEIRQCGYYEVRTKGCLFICRK
jgi:ubiquinone/menaquinone biosynthesis C-methylase UbiE